jgi:hypothetical protein
MRVVLTNDKQIVCRNINIEGTFIQNNGTFFGLNIVIIGCADKVLLENNQSLIPYESLKVKTVIFHNAKDG